jgi:L,D-peptidoglycan transpeptidase YkuD (ErfK/YbiS/YcfS/YnhG family)
VTANAALRRLLVLPNGTLTAEGIHARCALGRAGITGAKREGDGATPRGRFRLLAAMYRPDRLPRPLTYLPLSAIRPDSGWCDDPTDRAYNQPVRLPYAANHEELWRADHLYDVVIVLDYNIRPPSPAPAAPSSSTSPPPTTHRQPGAWPSLRKRCTGSCQGSERRR